MGGSMRTGFPMCGSLYGAKDMLVKGRDVSFDSPVLTFPVVWHISYTIMEIRADLTVLYFIKMHLFLRVRIC